MPTLCSTRTERPPRSIRQCRPCRRAAAGEGPGTRRDTGTGSSMPSSAASLVAVSSSRSASSSRAPCRSGQRVAEPPARQHGRGPVAEGQVVADGRLEVADRPVDLAHRQAGHAQRVVGRAQAGHPQAGDHGSALVGEQQVVDLRRDRLVAEEVGGLGDAVQGEEPRARTGERREVAAPDPGQHAGREAVLARGRGGERDGRQVAVVDRAQDRVVGLIVEEVEQFGDAALEPADAAELAAVPARPRRGPRRRRRVRRWRRRGSRRARSGPGGSPASPGSSPRRTPPPGGGPARPARPVPAGRDRRGGRRAGTGRRPAT